MSEDNFVGVVIGVVGVLVFTLIFTAIRQNIHRSETSVIVGACGECDHVGECGDYECRPGVDGWQLKAGAR
jgi:hypothetical protein